MELMSFKNFHKFLRSRIFGAFSAIVIVFSLGSIVLSNLDKFLGGHGLDDVITSRGIRTNPISILILFSLTAVAAIVTFFAIRNKNNTKKIKKGKRT
jgi:Ca2+/Na+ antiporter